MSGKIQQALKQKTFVAALSQRDEWEQMVEEVASTVKNGLGDRSCDAALVFVSEPFRDVLPSELVGRLNKKLSCGFLMGCNASGVVGTLKEVEMESALSVLAMHLPQVEIAPFSLSQTQLEAMKDGADLMKTFDVFPTDKPHVLCVADAMTCDAQKFVNLFNEAYEKRPIVGGLASGAAMGLPNWVALNGEVLEGGMVGAVLTGQLEIETVVAQGCRPIGVPLVVTKADGQVLQELAGRPALQVLSQVFEQLSSEDKKLARQSLFVGLVMHEEQAEFKRGDFLIRNVVGVDGKNGALVIGAHLRVGQTLQFQLRDAATSTEDLTHSLQALPISTTPPKGGFLVSCCGRGKGLYGVPDHDISTVQSLVGPLPIAGMFANGEIGPVGGKNYIHGFTSCLAIIR